MNDVTFWLWLQCAQMYITLFVQTITRELCRASRSHIAQAQELSSSVRKDNSFLLYALRYIQWTSVYLYSLRGPRIYHYP